MGWGWVLERDSPGRGEWGREGSLQEVRTLECGLWETLWAKCLLLNGTRVQYPRIYIKVGLGQCACDPSAGGRGRRLPEDF